MLIKDLDNTATDFASDDYIAIDGATNGSRKMKNDSLLKVTAQNALAGNLAPAFVPNSTTTVAGQLYVYNGSLYLAKVSGYQGSWDASKFNSYSVDNLKSLSDLNNDICTRNSIQLDNGVIGYYLNASGEFVKSDSHYVSDYFAVSENDVVVWTSGEISNDIVLALYDSDKKFVAYYRASTNPRTITIGSGYSFIRASFKKNSVVGLSINGVAKDVSLTSLSNAVDNLKSLSDLNNDICTRNSIQLDNGVIGYYLNASGEFVKSDSHYVSDYFAVSENDVVVWTSGEISNDIVLALYDSDKKFVIYYRGTSNPRTITIGSGYSFIRASFKINATTGLSIAGVAKDVSVTTLSKQILSSISVESEKKDLRIYNGVRGFYLNTSGNFVESDSHYVSDYFAVSENDVVVWTSGEISNDIVLALYDSDKKFVNYYRASSNPRTITIGSGFSYIRASFKKDSVVGLSINGVKKDISLRELTHSVTTIRFGTYNTGNFAGIDMATGSQEVAMAMREAIAEANCDVMATQEDTPYFNADSETLSRDECFGLFKYYTRKGERDFNYKAFASNYKITNINVVGYGNGFDHYYFLTGDLNVSGIGIKLICIHLDWADNTRRQTQLSQIATYADNYDNVIIMGDFNPENCINNVPQFDPDTYEGLDTSDTDLAILESVGFKAVNGGYLPKKTTYYGAYTRDYVWRCDNILVKSTDGKLVYKDLGVLHKDYMNDHFIVYSDISILSE